MDDIDLAIESLKTHIEYDKKVMNTGTINISMVEAENILRLLKEYKEYYDSGSIY